MAYSILVVDDERVVRRVLSIMLTQAGWHVDQAADGFEAILMVQTKQPDVVVLDIMMPQMDGYEVLQVLRNEPETAELPVVILSAKMDDTAIKKGLDLGANRYLVKPVRQHILVQTIEEVLTGRDSDGKREPFPDL